MAMPNRERIQRALEQLREGLVPFVERELRAKLGNYWLEELQSKRKEPIVVDGATVRWDNQALLKAMIDNWQSVFRSVLGNMERALVSELLEVRNGWAHEKAFSSDDTYRAIDSIQRLLEAVGAPERAGEVGKLKSDLQRAVFDEQARNQTRYQMTLEGMPNPNLKPWREVVTPHPDVASGRYMEAEFAADLAQVHAGIGSPEYRDPVEFFRRTYITEGLRDLLVGGLQRLAGNGGGDPVVELQTNFGGGKTHSMLALYHIVGGTPVSQLFGLEAVLDRARVTSPPTARRAVLVGTHLSPGEITRKPDGTTIRTMWGEMAWQLLGPEGFAFVADSDARSVSPGSAVLIELFRKAAPCLVLIDEWVAFARQLVNKRDMPAGDFEAQASFAQALTEAAKAVPGCLVVASIPASKLEIGGEHGEIALETLKNVFERVGRPWRPANPEEGFEIVRRRLFEPINDRQRFAERDAVINGFAKLYKDAPDEFPPEVAEPNYRESLRAAYPIHPELFQRLYKDWSELDKFQRTRGVLRLLAKVIHRLWENNDSGLLILPASIPMDDAAVKSELTRYLDDNWEAIISADVDGNSSLPLEIDRANPNLGRYSASRRVTRTLYVGTAPGARGRNPGIDDRAVRLGTVQPGETVGTFLDALRRVADKGRYIHQDGNRYWISTRANLNRLADDRASSYLRDPAELHAEIESRLKKDTARGDFAALHICPETSGDVPDEPTARLVVLGPTVPHRPNQADSPASKEARSILEGRGNAPRLNRNTLVFLSADARSLDDLMQAVAQYRAWKSIVEQKDLNLDDRQRSQAVKKQDDADNTIKLRIHTTWTHIHVPIQPDPRGEVQWTVLKLPGQGPQAPRVAAKLKNEELLLPAMGATRLRMEIDRSDLWQGKDHVGLAQLAEWFPRYLYLPRLVNRATLENAVRDAFTQLMPDEVFGVADGWDEETQRYRGLRVGAGNPPVLGAGTLLVKPTAARAQLEADAAAERERLRKLKEKVEPVVPDGGGSADDEDDTDIPTGPPIVKPPPPPPVAKRPKRFFGEVVLDGQRPVRDLGRIVDEVLQHLSGLPGAKVTLTLDVQVSAPEGVPEDVARTVSENCRVLRFGAQGFEGE